MKKNYLLMVLCTSMFLVKISVTEAQTTLKQRLEKHVYTLADDSLKGRHSGSTYGHKAAEYIVNQWKEIGIPPYQSDTYFQPFNNNCKNIIGILHGNDSTLKNEYIIIGAHYDHLGFKLNNGDTIIYNGADDNASGVATLIELSRKLNEIRHSLQRSVILVAFDAEETGLNGSSHLADNPVVPLTNIKLMFSVDMVGWYKASGYVQYSGAGTIADSKNILLNSGLVPEGLHVVTQDFEKSLFTATDTQPFAQKGIPTLAVTTGLKSPYHKPEDDADLIDYDGMTLIVEHLANVVETVSKDRNYSASGKLASKHIKRNPKKILVGLSANLGSNYHYYTAGAVNGKAADSYGIGLMSQINMGQWAIRPEVYYEYVQAKYPAGTIRTNNVTLPLNLVLQTTGSKANAEVFFGAYYSHKFSGKMGNENLDFVNGFYRNEAGLNYGFGFRVMKIKLNYTSRYGLTNITRFKNDYGAHLHNIANYMTITYLF